MAGLLDVLVGAAGGINEQVQRRQEQAMKLQQIMAEAQAKQLYPDAQEQARRQILGLIGNIQPTPTPDVSGFGSGYTPQEQAQGIPQMVEQASKTRNAPVINRLGMLSTVAHNIDPLSALMTQRYLEQMDTVMGGKSGGPLGGGQPQATPPQTPSAESSINDYVRQLAQQRSTPRVLSYPAFSIAGGRASFSQKPIPPRPVPEGSLTKITDADEAIRDLEGMLLQSNQFANKLGPLNPELKRNFFSNVLRQYDPNSQLDPFIRGTQTAELRFRKSLEGLRFISGGQSIAQQSFPDPRNQRYDQFRQTALDFIARSLINREKILQTLHDTGYDSSSVQPMTSVYGEQLPVGRYLTTTAPTGGQPANSAYVNEARRRGFIK